MSTPLTGTVSYTVPVDVEIEDGEIVAVRVWDESVRLDEDENRDDPLVQLAEAEPWPAWVIG